MQNRSCAGAGHTLCAAGRDGALDGQISLAVFHADDHDLDRVALVQMVVDVIDVGMRHLGDVYHTGRPVRQRDERAEFGQALDFTLYDHSNCKLLHIFRLIPHV